MAMLDAPDLSLDRATWGLVIVTALLVVGTIATFTDGTRRGRLQDKRWENEDKHRIEDAEPRALVELATYLDDSLRLLFVVYNLGNNTFLIDKLIVKVNNTKIEVPQQTPQIVTPGNWVSIEFEPRLILSPNGGNTPSEEGYGTIVLKGATGSVITKSEWFHVFYAQPSRPDRFPWGMGRSGLPPGTLVETPRVLPSPPIETNRNS